MGQRPLEEKVVLVTGGGKGLGRAITEGVARLGAKVAVHYHRSEVGANQVVTAIRAESGRAEAFGADLTQTSEIEPLVAQVEAKLGPISVLINLASIFRSQAFLETSVETLDEQWALNVRAPYLLTQAVARRMVARDGGDVVNILDVLGPLGAPGAPDGPLTMWSKYSAYGISKSGLEFLTRCLAVELAPAVRVNAVAPGTVFPGERLEPVVLEALRQKIPQQQFGHPDDFVQAVVFFLTGPRFITGQILAVDGGRSSVGP